MLLMFALHAKGHPAESLVMISVASGNPFAHSTDMRVTPFGPRRYLAAIRTAGRIVVQLTRFRTGCRQTLPYKIREELPVIRRVRGSSLRFGFHARIAQFKRMLVSCQLASLCFRGV